MDMAKICKIDSAGLGAKVLILAREGRSSREIASILAADFGFRVPHTTVANYIKANQEERAARVKAAVDEQVERDLPSDLERLNEYLDRLDMISGNAAEKTCDRISAIDKAVKVIDTKLRYSGAGQPGGARGSGILVYIPSNGRDTL